MKCHQFIPEIFQCNILFRDVETENLDEMVTLADKLKQERETEEQND